MISQCNAVDNKPEVLIMVETINVEYMGENVIITGVYRDIMRILLHFPQICGKSLKTLVKTL